MDFPSPKRELMNGKWKVIGRVFLFSWFGSACRLALETIRVLAKTGFGERLSVSEWQRARKARWIGLGDLGLTDACDGDDVGQLELFA